MLSDHPQRRALTAGTDHSEHGRAVRGAIERERDDLERRATKTLTEAERTAVLSALRKMIAQFDVTETPPPDPAG